MAGNCRYVLNERALEARWRREGKALVVTPSGAPALVLELGEVSGIGGDGFAIHLGTALGEVRLERLGADGPTLLKELQRDWPPLRAKLLRLAASEPTGKVFSGQVQLADGAYPFRAYVVDDRLILAPQGRDVRAMFLTDCSTLAFSEASYAVVCTGWDGQETQFSKLAGETPQFLDALRTARERLALQADEVLSKHLPSLPLAERMQLASQWLPGRGLSFAELEKIAVGFEAAFLASWLAACPRQDEGLRLMQGVGPTERYLGYAAPVEGEEPMLWLLVRAGEQWSHELLSHGDYATYLFNAGDEMPALFAGLIRMPEFSREALYMPLEDLTGERAKYVIPARSLPLLVQLRERFAGRRIHAPRS